MVTDEGLKPLAGPQATPGAETVLPQGERRWTEAPRWSQVNFSRGPSASREQ